VSLDHSGSTSADEPHTGGDQHEHAVQRLERKPLNTLAFLDTRQQALLSRLIAAIKPMVARMIIQFYRVINLIILFQTERGGKYIHQQVPFHLHPEPKARVS
jgi:hypothetical protein